MANYFITRNVFPQADARGIFPVMKSPIPSPTARKLRYLIIAGLAILMISGCRTQEIVVRTPEEIVFARLAVVEMMEVTTKAAADNFQQNGTWNGSFAELVPPQAAEILPSMETIPGIRRLMDNYLTGMNSAIASIARDIPQYLQDEVFPDLEIADPFRLIEGQNDAVTRYFATTVSGDLEKWIESRLTGEQGSQAVLAWDTMVRTYNTYAKSQNLLHAGDPDLEWVLLDADPIRTVLVSMLRALLSVMTSQEALVRTMAPAYDNPLITIYAGR